MNKIDFENKLCQVHDYLIRFHANSGLFAAGEEYKDFHLEELAGKFEEYCQGKQLSYVFSVIDEWKRRYLNIFVCKDELAFVQNGWGDVEAYQRCKNELSKFFANIGNIARGVCEHDTPTFADIIKEIQDRDCHRREPQPLASVQVTAKDDAALSDFSHMKSFKPTIEFDMSALYSFLIDENVIDVDEELFANCISHANVNELWECEHAVKNRKHNLLQCLFKMLKDYYPEKWIYKCAENLNVDKKKITNPTTSGATKPLEDKLRLILKGKSIK